jgi:filamentous hemagglutinin
MNQQTYRIVFNQSRGCLMVVAETATSHGKSASGERAGRASVIAAGFFTPLAWACKLMGQAVFLSATCLCFAPLQVQAQAVATRIVADPTAARTQQATILNTSSGVVQVNIQTPSVGGVSRNTYSQFDVGSRGAILNNSRTNVQTQQGGWVQGNPWLATGQARVILNEVNSSNPSLLKGYVEVAGQRAEVIIANPAGITVSGAGFINASGVTLTTGTPVMNGAGSLESYRVQRGSVTVDGEGLDTRTADYTAILARAAQLNAGIWANQLQVVTGANVIQAASVGADTTPQATALSGTGEAPAYALDVSQLGGMYAGKITLIGTEAGLGVRNAGWVQANSGTLTLTQEGWLSNSGTLLSDGAELNIQARGVVEQNGTVYSKGVLNISTQDRQTYTGITAAQGSIQIQAKGDIEGGRGSLLAAGLQQDGALVGRQNLNLQANGVGRKIQYSGQAVASDSVHLAAAGINLDQSQVKATSATLQATEMGMVLSRAQIDVVQSLNLSTPKQLVTDQAQIRADQLSVQATAWSNRAGQVQQGGSQALVIDLQAGALDNSAGQLVTNAADLSLKVGAR